MCNRFALPTPEEIAEHFGLADLEDLPPRFNVAPGEQILVVSLRGGARTAERCTWGLLPSWVRDARKPLLNVRAEALAGRPGRSPAVRQGRCLVPAGGFFEWRKVGRVRQPYYFRLEDSSLLGLAALSEAAPGEQGARRCAIVTTEPNSLVAEIHDRMPLVVPRDAYEAWLDPELGHTELASLLRPYPAELMKAYPVSSIVNRTGVDDPRAIEPARQESLF